METILRQRLATKGLDVSAAIKENFYSNLYQHLPCLAFPHNTRSLIRYSSINRKDQNIISESQGSS